MDFNRVVIGYVFALNLLCGIAWAQATPGANVDASIEEAQKARAEYRAGRYVEAAQGLQWNERGERGVMAGDADVPKAMGLKCFSPLL